MVIEGKSRKFRLQPPKSNRLNLVNHLNYRAFFVFEEPDISLFPHFPNHSKPNDLRDRAAHLCGATAKTELIKVVRHIIRDDRRDAKPSINKMPDRPKNITMQK
jgi:hypothetical protein